MHTVWNVHFEAASLRKEDKGSEGEGAVTFQHIVKGLHVTKGAENDCFGGGGGMTV